MAGKKSSSTRGRAGAVDQVNGTTANYVLQELPSPDMAVVEKFIETAKDKARAASTQRRKERSSPASSLSLGNRVSAVFSGGMCRSLVGPVKDFVVGFILTFFVMYVMLAALYRGGATSVF